MSLLDPIKREPGEHFHICETCGYERGFHTTLRKEGGEHEIILVCPECGQQYIIGWKLSIHP